MNALREPRECLVRLTFIINLISELIDILDLARIFGAMTLSNVLVGYFETNTLFMADSAK